MRSSTYFAAFPLWKALRELSSAGSERLPYKQRVGGSNPSAPTNERRRLRFLKRLFLFSGRVGRCGTRWSVRVGPVEVDGAGRGGRCGSRWTVRVGVVGAGRVGTRRIGPGRPVRVGWCGTRRRAVSGCATAGLGRTVAVIVCAVWMFLCVAAGVRAHCCRYRVIVCAPLRTADSVHLPLPPAACFAPSAAPASSVSLVPRSLLRRLLFVLFGGLGAVRVDEQRLERELGNVVHPVAAVVAAVAVGVDGGQLDVLDAPPDGQNE